MKVGVLGALVATSLFVVSPAHAQEECPAGRPEVLVAGMIPVIGDGPLWAGVGTGAIPPWGGPNAGVWMLWIRDYEISGPAVISGANRASGAKAAFAQNIEALSVRNERHRLRGGGFQPPKISQGDLRRYSFHRGAVFFPEPGCYEITSRVGRETGTFYLNIEEQ
ncbi:MAG: hypothetical protein CL472_09430 [Acidobacteria bacterium]|nr:hypothetical protein [Acidobacteriota bacterium]